MINDLTSQGAGNLPKYAAAGRGANKQFDKNIGRVTSQAEDAQVGYLFQTSVTGAHSHLTRDVLVYLPPQYFQKPFRHYKFPVIELLHGSPGGPRAWVDVMAVIPTFLSLLGTHPKDAAVLVMPDTDGGPQYGLQCLNNPGGIQDMTFVARDVPDAIARIARVQPPGLAWGLAGYSEGGYCAANIALQDPQGYGAAGVLSGYFGPIKSQVPAGNKPDGRPLTVNVFLGHPGLELVNTPRYYVTRVPVNDQLPAFWLAVGAEDKADVGAALDFRQRLQTRMVNVPLKVMPGGGHSANVWRAALGPMLGWMTPHLAGEAAQADATAARTAAKAAVARTAAARKAHYGEPRRPHAAMASKKP
jgi:enterochelin esterase-like enzyme